MLVLSRRPMESVVFPELQISVQVLEIKGDRVRLGFEAPPSVTIKRGELGSEMVVRSAVAAQPRIRPPAAVKAKSDRRDLRRSTGDDQRGAAQSVPFHVVELAGP